MILLKKEEFFERETFEKSGSIDFSKRELNDALAKKIISCKYEAKSYFLNSNEVDLNLKVLASIEYLDSRTLEPLVLEINFSEDIPFSDDLKTAEKLDIDYFKEEIDLEELIFELIVVYIPINYSESSNDLIKAEKDLDETSPFKDVFKNQKDSK